MRGASAGKNLLPPSGAPSGGKLTNGASPFGGGYVCLGDAQFKPTVIFGPGSTRDRFLLEFNFNQFNTVPIR